jgi:nucleoside-diphosphate-sugar epimerase/ubiquinone/menaquinone biosynthesis C-methylase UbiE
MRVLVTGHNGYIGCVMVPMLRAAGHDVVGIDSELFREFRLVPYKSGVPEICLDVRDIEPKHLEGFDAVIHLAALSNDALSNLKPDITYQINHAASVRLGQLAKSAGVSRFIFSSSCSIYGKAGDDLVAEDGTIEVLTPYTISKDRVERELAKMASDKFSPTYMRNATAYGISPCHSFDLVLNNLVAWAYAAGRVHIKSDGSPWRPTVHIEDISRAFLAALEAPREAIHNQAFNVGSTEENYTVTELAEIVRAVVPGSTVEYAEGGKPDPRSYRVNFSKIHRLLPASKPHWNAGRGAEQLYAAYNKAGVTVSDFEGPRFKRIDHVKQQLANGHLDATLRWTNPSFVKETAMSEVLNPELSAKIKKYWDERARDTAPTSAQATTYDVFLRAIEIEKFKQKISEASLPEGSTVVDLGCGDGHATTSVAAAFPHLRFIGIDWSPNMLNLAKKRSTDQGLSGRMSFYQGDVRRVSDVLKGAKHEVFLTSRSLINLMYSEEQYGAIAQIAEHLKPGGYYFGIENFMGGQKNFNDARAAVGLPEIPVRWHNHFFEEKEYAERTSKHFDSLSFESFLSSYYLATRVIYSAGCHLEGKEPDYFDPIHQIAGKLPPIGDFCPIKLVSMRRKFSAA